MALGGGYSEVVNAAVNAAIDDVSISPLPLSLSLSPSLELNLWMAL